MSVFRARAEELKQVFVDYRRDFHKHPELGLEEVRTSGIVANYLENLGIKVQRVATTGVVGLLQGGKPGKTIALRADMDALTLTELADIEYASQEEGKMHACGHDGHTAILMGVAKLLSEVKEEIPGNVKFFFQPAEEGPGGALPMIEEGVMENPHVDAIVGLHLNTTDGVAGQIGVRAGASTASSDGIGIRVKGYGGHGAHPHKAVDAVVVAGHLIVALQTIVSREIDPLGAAVISLGTVNGGSRGNIIAEEVTFTGTVRTLDPKVREAMPERIKRIIKGVCDTFRCTYEFRYGHGYPSIINDEEMVELVAKVGKEVLGDENVIYLPNPAMGGEDFSYFAQKAPGCFFRLMAGSVEKGFTYPGHNPRYNFDEDAIPVGMTMLSEVALAFLKK